MLESMTEREHQLTPESLALVIEELFEANPKWYDTGLMLGLSSSVLDIIKHQNEERDCFREMLKAWFKHAQECSWKALVAALNTSLVGEHKLAGRLEKKYVVTGPVSHTRKISSKQAFNDDDYSETLSLSCSRTSSGSDVSASIKQDQSLGPPFGCGCGRCNINNFLDGRCLKPEKSSSSFPFLNTAAMKETDVLILKGRLYEEFCLITREFSKFRTAICESLVDRDVPVRKLVRALRDLRAFSHAHSDVPLLGSCWETIAAAKTIDDVFDITTDYVSFFNFQITEHIVDSLGTDQDKALLCDYRKKRDEYCKRNIFECPSYSSLSIEEPVLVMKLEGIEKYSMKHLSGLISHMSRALSVANQSLKLCTVEEGCIKLIFQVPHSIKDNIFPLSYEALLAIMEVDIHIVLLKCGRWLYQFPSSQEKMVDHPYKHKGIYNHGILARNTAELMLKSVDYECFLIRESERFKNHLVYSIKQKNKFTHILLEEKSDGTYGLKGEGVAYPSLDFFITNVARGFCLMPLRLKDIEMAKISSALKVECEKGPTADSTDAGVHDLDDNTGDYTDEGARSGDSAIFLGCRLPPPRPPHECSSATYKKLDLSTMDVVKPYASLLDTSQRSTNSTNK